MNTCNLNNLEYNIQIQFIRSNRIIDIPLDNILELKIINDCYEPIPRAEITIKDPESSELPLYAPDNKSKVVIYIESKDSSSGDLRTIRKIHSYTINKVKPLNLDGNSDTYNFNLISEYLIKWNDPITYSTGDKKLFTTEIIFNLMKKIDLDIIKPETESKYKTLYITDTQTTLKDHISHLLDLSSINNSGFYYLWYNQIDNKINIESLYNKGLKSVKTYNAFTIPSNDIGVNEVFTPRSIEFTNDVTALQIDKIVKGFAEYNFDQSTRTSSERVILYNNIENNLTLPNNSSVINNNDHLDIDVNLIQHANNFDWFKKVRKSIREVDGLVMTVFGNLQRDIGDSIIFISTGIKLNKYAGIWINMRTIDIYRFGANKFDQQIFVSRISKLEELLNVY